MAIIGISVWLAIINIPLYSVIIFASPILLYFLVKLLKVDYRKILLIMISGGILLGWRGVEILPNFRIFPSEYFIWIGFFINLFDSLIKNKPYKRMKWPWQAIFLGFATIFAVVLAGLKSRPANLYLSEAKSFFVFIPLLIIFKDLITTKKQILTVVYAVTFSCVIIALLGVIERFFPQISSLLPWLFTNSTYSRNNFNFGSMVELSGFSFWGSPVISVFLVMGLGLWTAGLSVSKKILKLLWIISGMILILGILVSGYRTSWIGLIVVLLLLFLNKSNYGLFLIGIVGISFYLLPEGFLDRLLTAFRPLQSGDTSVLFRTEALKAGLIILRDNWLFGTGWNTKIVFNDWLYLAIVLGLPALIIFVSWYYLLLRKLRNLTNYVKRIDKTSRQIALGFFIGAAGYIFCMISGAMSQVPPIMVSFWVVFCAAWRYCEVMFLELRNDQSEQINSLAPNI